MTADEASRRIQDAILEDHGAYLSPSDALGLDEILCRFGVPESEADCVALVMGEEDDTGARVPERLKIKHPELDAWLDELLT